MTEKAYKTMVTAGAADLVIGIILILTGLVSGIWLIVDGVRLLKHKSGLTF